jgi:23S rRNA (adenine2503-C2)-methyltransferase
MKILAQTSHSDIAKVYVASFADDRIVEFVESTEPPIPKADKWVLIISTMLGCPVGCKFCDSGLFYGGKLNEGEMLRQILFLVENSYPDRKVESKKFKIQFARMGEPALNMAVCDTLINLPTEIDAPGLLPSVSSIAPKGSEKFFDKIHEIKNDIYKNKFQLQFSLHSTNQEQRDWLLPVKKWDFKTIARYGENYFAKGNRKITLNFALGAGMEINPNVLLDQFDPEIFFIKLTPVNPTYNSQKNEIKTVFDENKENGKSIIESLKKAGYDTLLSIGEIEENKIGSNCGQHILNYMKSGHKLNQAYTYNLEYL